ncbi:MAG: zf-HC2 domain-containing protein [Planctomycetota bacterium]|nr:zf-HC2 domain-containing protein [Planctomycetota bacterium]
MTTDDESRIGWLLEHTEQDDAADDGPHLDDNLLTGFVEGALPAELRDRIDAHLVACAACRAEVVARGAWEPSVVYEPAVPDQPEPESWLRPLLAVAAAILLAVGVFLLDDAAGVDPEPDTATLVARSAKRLGAADAALAELGTMDWSALPKVDVERGDLRVTAPAGKLLVLRPRITWTPVNGVTRFRVAVRNDLGDVVLEQMVAGTSMDWPLDASGLDPGTYAVKVTADSALARVAARRAFTIPPDADREALATELYLIREGADPAVAELLVAEHAARRGYLAVAETAAMAFLSTAPDDPLGREALAALAAALGTDAE